jgi:Right handed beta helix region
VRWRRHTCTTVSVRRRLRGSHGKRLAGAGLALAAALLLPALASAHLERPSYWPDPAPDRSVSPPAGGQVPKARSLASAVTGRGPGEVRVVCKGSSLRLAKRSIAAGARRGFRIRPSQPKERLGGRDAARLLAINRALFDDCRFRSIQKAVNRSGNNDRIVIMPGRYREVRSRRAPVDDPRCFPELTQADSSGALTPSYEYQATCPNDQNLVYVQGRAVKGEPLDPPNPDRHGIPEQELGRCVRCNLQIEGSGVRPEDVIIDGGSRYRGNGPQARPSAFAKHVILRVDRADGFVGRNFLMRGALEFGFYTEETDGVLLDRTKFFWAADYGHLSFTTDHNVIRNCDGFGAGDAVVYPGAAPETGSQARLDFYPDAPRMNTVVKNCDLHGSVLAYSGSMGNAVRITRNHIYGNTAGISTDTVSAAGHPGFPADSVKVDHNYIYSNNLDLFRADPPVPPVVGVLPVGVGIVWPGHNDGRVHDNWIWDNWRYGAMLFAVPDAVVGLEPEGSVNDGISCPTAPTVTTSCGNRFFDNELGRVPAGFKPFPAMRKFGNEVGGTRGIRPNGTDFWWDEFLGNTGNCWYDNRGPDGTAASVTGPGPGAPPDLLPSPPLCETVAGLSDAVKEVELLACFLAREGGGPEDACGWFDMPPKPASPAAARAAREARAERPAIARSDEARRVEAWFESLAAETGLEPPGADETG